MMILSQGFGTFLRICISNSLLVTPMLLVPRQSFKQEGLGPYWAPRKQN